MLSARWRYINAGVQKYLDISCQRLNINSILSFSSDILSDDNYFATLGWGLNFSLILRSSTIGLPDSALHTSRALAQFLHLPHLLAPPLPCPASVDINLYVYSKTDPIITNTSFFFSSGFCTGGGRGARHPPCLQTLMMSSSAGSSPDGN